MDKKIIPLFAVHMPEEVDKPLLQVLHSGYIGQGSKVEEFEKALAGIIGNQNVLSLNSATSGLHLALRLIGVEGGEVISTAMTCTATNMPILANNAKIVWADIAAQTGLIDPLDIERKITANTKAIMVVDWGGTPVDLDRVMEIAHRYNIPVIEDAAHAFLGSYQGKRIGTIADYTVFSFQAIKHITSVDGGALFIRSTEQYKRGKLLRWYGIDRETERKDFRCEENIKEWGYKFHMNDINATIGLAQLPFAQDIVDKHRANSVYYDTALSNYYVKTHLTSYSHNGSFWLYTILLPTLEDRLAFMAYMKEKGIMVSQVHARNDLHTAFLSSKANLPGVDSFTKRQVSIPVHWKLSGEERKYIADSCNEFAKKI